jgi:hypothetical protein
MKPADEERIAARLAKLMAMTLVVENQTHRPLAHFRGKLVHCLAHDAPSYSRVGASRKPGAVHCRKASSDRPRSIVLPGVQGFRFHSQPKRFAARRASARNQTSALTRPARKS